MSAAGKKGTRDVRPPGEMTRFETASSAATSIQSKPLAAPAETTAVELISSAPAVKGIASSDTLADAHVELTRAFGLLLTMPEVELALRHSGGWYGARNMLFRHQELARARGAQ